MYTIVTTPGFVIESKPKGEADKMFLIFTRDLGLIMAVAQGIRLEKSKLRYRAREYVLSTFSFVRGKEFWRLIDIGSETIKLEKIDMVVKIALLIKRFFHFDEPHPKIFDCVKSAVDFISQNEKMSDKDSSSLESLTVLRIMHDLGYVGNNAKFADYINSLDVNRSILDSVQDNLIFINQNINKGIKESHL